MSEQHNVYTVEYNVLWSCSRRSMWTLVIGDAKCWFIQLRSITPYAMNTVLQLRHNVVGNDTMKQFTNYQRFKIIYVDYFSAVILA